MINKDQLKVQFTRVHQIGSSDSSSQEDIIESALSKFQEHGNENSRAIELCDAIYSLWYQSKGNLSKYPANNKEATKCFTKLSSCAFDFFAIPSDKINSETVLGIIDKRAYESIGYDLNDVRKKFIKNIMEICIYHLKSGTDLSRHGRHVEHLIKTLYIDKENFEALLKHGLPFSYQLEDGKVGDCFVWSDEGGRSNLFLSLLDFGFRPEKGSNLEKRISKEYAWFLNERLNF